MATNQHITKNSDGNWWVRWAWSSKYTKMFKTQQQAIQYWTVIAKNQWSELFIHWKDGKIRERNTYWKDPFPPRG